MVGTTRGHPEGYDHTSSSGAPQQALFPPLPPSGAPQQPPPLNFGEFIVAQTELLRHLVQGQQHQQHRGGHQAPPHRQQDTQTF